MLYKYHLTFQIPYNRNKLYKIVLRVKNFKFVLSICAPAVDVVYQGSVMLVLKSTYIDTIRKAVESAKKDGYRIEGISTFITSNQVTGGGSVNVLVAMSKM